MAARTSNQPYPIRFKRKVLRRLPRVFSVYSAGMRVVTVGTPLPHYTIVQGARPQRESTTYQYSTTTTHEPLTRPLKVAIGMAHTACLTEDADQCSAPQPHNCAQPNGAATTAPQPINLQGSMQLRTQPDVDTAHNTNRLYVLATIQQYSHSATPLK